MEAAVYQEFLELEATHWWFQGRRAIFVALLDRHVGRAGSDAARRRRRLMDIGCGVGGMLGPMADYGTVIGTDVAYLGLQHCAARGFPRLVACTGPDGCFRDGAFDCITAFDALEHIEDDLGSLREIRRMLAPGGVLIASGPAYQFLYSRQDRITHHVRRYTLSELGGKAEAAGLELVKASYINFLLFPAILPAVLALKGWQKLSGGDRNEQAGSNVGIPIPRALNATLSAVFRSEARLLSVLSAPAGHSLVVVAKKPR